MSSSSSFSSLSRKHTNRLANEHSPYLLQHSHNPDKPALFKSFYKWLKPGGQVLISDYCKCEGSPSLEFAAYIKQRGYDLHSVEAYGQMLRDAGFDEVVAEDRTDQFMKVLQRELQEVEKDKQTFIDDFSEVYIFFIFIFQLLFMVSLVLYLYSYGVVLNKETSSLGFLYSISGVESMLIVYLHLLIDYCFPF